MFESLSDRLVLFDADPGAGGSSPAPGADSTQTPATPPQGGDTLPAGQDPPASPLLVDVTATDEQGRKLWYSWEDHVKVHQEAASWRTKYQELAKKQESGTPAGQEADPAHDPAHEPPPDTAVFEQQITALKSEKTALLIANAVIAEAAKSTAERDAFIDPALAVKLADLSGITVGEDGVVSGATEAVAALASASPFLLKPKPAGQPPVTRSPNPARSETLTLDHIKTMTPQEYLSRQAEVDAFLKAQYTK